MTRVSNPIFTIASGASLSDLIDVKGTLAGLIFPAAMSSATLTIQSSYDGVVFNDIINDDGTAYTVTITSSKFVALNWQKLLGARNIRLKTVSTESGARTILGAVYHS